MQMKHPEIFGHAYEDFSDLDVFGSPTIFDSVIHK